MATPVLVLAKDTERRVCFFESRGECLPSSADKNMVSRSFDFQTNDVLALTRGTS